MIPKLECQNRTEQGRLAEEAAALYLENHGLAVVERNYRCRSGEIDLIMKDRDYLVFIEVRYRKHTGYGGAAASVDYRKQKKLLRTAQHWLQQSKASNCRCRFDVVAVTPGSNRAFCCDWITNAFEL